SFPFDAWTAVTRPDANSSSSSSTTMPPTIASGRVARTRPSVRAGSGSREDLLRRDVRHVVDPVDGGRAAADPLGLLEQADGQLRPGPAELDRVESSLVQERRPALQLRCVLAPRLDGIVLVEADCVRDQLPEPVDVRLAEDL